MIRHAELTPTIASEDGLSREHEWLGIGAIEKARSVRLLTRDLPIRSVLEIGCGTGALLEELDRGGFAERFYALEPSTSMYHHMRQRNAISRLVDAQSTTLAQSKFSDQRFDLAILSHVLEHVEAPAALLAEALGVAEYVLAEVPLEGNLSGNLRAEVRTRLTGHIRQNNAAGHIQFFSTTDVHRLVQWCGGEVIRRRLYVPRPQLRYLLSRGAPARRVYSAVLLGMAALLGDRVSSAVHHGHYAVLARTRGQLSECDRTRHTPLYYRTS